MKYKFDIDVKFLNTTAWFGGEELHCWRALLANLLPGENFNCNIYYFIFYINIFQSPVNLTYAFDFRLLILVELQTGP